MAQAKYGTGTITNKNGKWIWTGYYKDKEGKIKRPQKSFKTEEEALIYQAKQISKATIKKEMRTQDITLDTVFKLWLKETDVKETTKRSIRNNYNTHFKETMGNQKIKKISTVSLEDVLNGLKDKGRKQKTIYNIYTDFKTIINFALDEGIIYENPLADFKAPKQPKQKTAHNVLSFEDYLAIIENEDNKKEYYYDAIVFLGETGIRVSELAFRKDDIQTTTINGEKLMYIDLDKTLKRVLNKDNETTSLKVIDEMKSDDSERIIYLNNFAVEAVKRQLAKKDMQKYNTRYVFTSTLGTLIDQRNILRTFHRMCKRAGVNRYGLHALRKCFINRALGNGIQPIDLAKYTGHSLQTMFNYYHELDKSKSIAIIAATSKR
jgi:integrase